VPLLFGDVSETEEPARFGEPQTHGKVRRHYHYLEAWDLPYRDDSAGTVTISRHFSNRCDNSHHLMPDQPLSRIAPLFVQQSQAFPFIATGRSTAEPIRLENIKWPQDRMQREADRPPTGSACKCHNLRNLSDAHED
jgi:hypothetical protein